jgi:hypothetical protein
MFFFFISLVFIWTIFYFIKKHGGDPHAYEWLITFPVIIVSVIALFKIRDRIKLSDRRAITGRSLLYWIILGVSLFLSYKTPVPASDYWSINTIFILATLFLADSYWDFKGITIKNFKDRKEIN